MSVVRLDLEWLEFALAWLVGRAAGKSDGLKPAMLRSEFTEVFHDCLRVLIAFELVEAIDDNHEVIFAFPGKLIQSNVQSVPHSLFQGGNSDVFGYREVVGLYKSVE